MKILMVNNYFKRSPRNMQDFEAFVETIKRVSRFRLEFNNPRKSLKIRTARIPKMNFTLLTIPPKLRVTFLTLTVVTSTKLVAGRSTSSISS